jgi:hypothetical protein
VPTVNAVGPLDIKGSKREVEVAIASALVCALLAAHVIYLVRRERT